MTYDNAGEQAAIQAQQVQVTWLEKGRSEEAVVWRNHDWKNGVKPVFVVNIQNRSYKINRLYIYIYTYIDMKTEHMHIYTSYVNTRVPKTMKPLHWNVFCFYEALVSLCSSKSLEPLSMRWYWRSYSLFKMVPTSSLCALLVQFPSDFSADQIPNQLNWPTK